MAKKLENCTALVTGATRGIGRAVAKKFAEEGAHLIVTGRTQGALEELDDEIQATGAQATLVPLDLIDVKAIDALGALLYSKFGHIDILVGNAAILGSLSPIAQTKASDWDQVMAINLTANWHLLRTLDPLLQRADAGRVIFVTSTVGHIPRAYWSAYAVSKAALEMMTKIYAEEQKKTNVCANLINPQATRTAMRREAFPGEAPDSIKPADDAGLLSLFLSLAAPENTKNGELFTP